MLLSQRGVTRYASRSLRAQLQTKAGEIRLKIPQLRRQTFETAIIERDRRRERSVGEALIESMWRELRAYSSSAHTRNSRRSPALNH